MKIENAPLKNVSDGTQNDKLLGLLSRFKTTWIRCLKLILVLDIVIEIKHAKFQPCKAPNIDTVEF